MLLPRSAEAVLAFHEAQEGLGENPPGSNANWITDAAGIGHVAWCVIDVWTARLAAGFNDDGKLLDFGTPASPPAWGRNPLPTTGGVGFGSTYRWGSAYVWAEASYAEQAGRWHPDLDDWAPGDSVCVNYNGRGGARTTNSHLATLIERVPGGNLRCWNGNISNRITVADFTPDRVEGLCRPAFVTSPAPAPHPQLEDDMAFRFLHKGVAYVSDGVFRRRIISDGVNQAMSRARVRPDGDAPERPDGTRGIEVWPPLWLDGGQEVQDDVFDQLVDVDSLR